MGKLAFRFHGNAFRFHDSSATLSWNALYQTAASPEGHFTTAQAAEAGYSSQLLAKHLRSGRIVRVYRGVYRLVHFPPTDFAPVTVPSGPIFSAILAGTGPYCH